MKQITKYLLVLLLSVNGLGLLPEHIQRVSAQTPSISTISAITGVHSAKSETVNTSQQEALLLIGDSMIDYSADNVDGPTPAANTVYEFNGTSIVQVTTGHLINSGNAGTGQGGPWTTCGINYYNATGRKLVFVDTHKFNSTCYKATASAALNWIYSTSYIKDGLYTAMKAKADAALLAVGVPRFKGIIINLTTNDLNSGDIEADVKTAYDSLIEYLHDDYPSSPIYIITPCNLSTSTTQTSRIANIRYYLSKRNLFHTDTHVIYNAIYGLSLGYLNAGPPHMDQGFNVAQGASIASYLNDPETDDDVKRITNMFYDPITVAQKLAYKTAITQLKSTGCWDKMNYWLAPRATTRRNLMMELMGEISPLDVFGGWTLSAGGYMETNGTTTFQETFYVPSLHTFVGSSTDYIQMSKVITNGSGTATAYLFDGLGNTQQVIQRTAGLRYRALDVTNTDYATETTFSNNTWYGIIRDGATKNLLKNTTIIHTASVPNTGLGTGRSTRGTQGTTAANVFTGTQGANVHAKYNGFNVTQFQSINDTLETAFP